MVLDDSLRPELFRPQLGTYVQPLYGVVCVDAEILAVRPDAVERQRELNTSVMERSPPPSYAQL